MKKLILKTALGLGLATSAFTFAQAAELRLSHQ